MDTATAQVLVSALLRVLDLAGRIAEKQFDSKEELETYIFQRNEVRDELVGLARQLSPSHEPDPVGPEEVPTPQRPYFSEDDGESPPAPSSE